MRKEIIQIRSFSRALSIICTILIVLLCIGAFSMLVALLMSGNSEFMAIFEQAFESVGMGGFMQIFGYFITYVLLNIAVYLVIAFMLRGVFRSISDYKIFDAENAKRLDKVSYIMIISAFVLPLVLTAGYLAVFNELNYTFSVNDIIMALGLLLFSKILLYGRAQKQALDEAQQELQNRYEQEHGVPSSKGIFREI